MDQFVAGIILIALIILGFFIFRAAVLWYWGITRIIELLEKIEHHLDKRSERA